MAPAVIAALIIYLIPDAAFLGQGVRISEVHLASAAIIRTALALAITLSLIPVQKAADVFSSAILMLYARDPRTIRVFATRGLMTVLSLLLGTRWAFGLSSRVLE